MLLFALFLLLSAVILAFIILALSFLRWKSNSFTVVSSVIYPMESETLSVSASAIGHTFFIITEGWYFEILSVSPCSFVTVPK